MKTKFLFTAVLFLGLIINSLAQSDSIIFAHNPSSEIFEMSKKEGKLIFVDIYTAWCPPCKKMAAKTFKEASVAKMYNENFICYKLDAEKGEGVEFAKKYQVKAYPTYLFLDENGKLIYTCLGYKEAAPFIEDANTALEKGGKKK